VLGKMCPAHKGLFTNVTFERLLSGMYSVMVREMYVPDKSFST
jgi:hypothetical protein